MGTFAIIIKLRRYWKYGTHPIYRLDGRRFNSKSWYRRFRSTRLGKTGFPVLLVALLLLGIVWPQFLIVVEGLGVFLCIAGLGIVLYLWPVIMSVATSGVIVGEREQQTWDTLLTIPCEWSDLILVKLASFLGNRRPVAYTLIWTIMTLGLIALNQSCGPNAYCTGYSIGDGLVLVAKLVVLITLLVITGYQLYILAILSGVLASLVAGSRAAASAAAALIGLGIVIVSNLGILLLQRGIESILFIFSSPSVPDHLVAGSITVGVMMLVNEVIVRRIFSNLIQHLGDGELLSWHGTQQDDSR